MPNQPDEVFHLETTREHPAPNQAPHHRRGASKQTVLIVGRIMLIVGMLALWQFADDRWVPDFVISSPLSVAARLVQDLRGPAIWADITTTSEELIMGYALGVVVGVALGFLLGLNQMVRGIFEPVIAAVNAIPKVALAPLFLVAMGLGPGSKVAIAAMMVALLMFYNTLGGVLVTPKPLIDVMRVIGARRGTIVRRVMLPFLSTYIIAGLKSSVPLAVVGVVVGEFIGADAGIGFRIRHATDLFDSAGLFSGVLILIVLTLIGNGLVQLLERRLLRWQR